MERWYTGILTTAPVMPSERANINPQTNDQMNPEMVTVPAFKLTQQILYVTEMHCSHYTHYPPFHYSFFFHTSHFFSKSSSLSLHTHSIS